MANYNPCSIHFDNYVSSLVSRTMDNKGISFPLSLVHCKTHHSVSIVILLLNLI